MKYNLGNSKYLVWGGIIIVAYCGYNWWSNKQAQAAVAAAKAKEIADKNASTASTTATAGVMANTLPTQFIKGNLSSADGTVQPVF